MIHTQRKQGFTAVELLITLFIGSFFLIAGFTLYGVVIKDNGTTRAQSIAANLAYNYLRQYSSYATTPCTSTTPASAVSITAAGISAAKVTVTITCPYGTGFPSSSPTQGFVPTTAQQAISKVSAVVTYNNPAQSIRNTVYVGQ